jgi:hypothetical protein
MSLLQEDLTRFGIFGHLKNHRLRIRGFSHPWLSLAILHRRPRLSEPGCSHAIESLQLDEFQLLDVRVTQDRLSSLVYLLPRRFDNSSEKASMKRQVSNACWITSNTAATKIVMPEGPAPRTRYPSSSCSPLKDVCLAITTTTEYACLRTFFLARARDQRKSQSVE